MPEPWALIQYGDRRALYLRHWLRHRGGCLALDLALGARACELDPWQCDVAHARYEVCPSPIELARARYKLPGSLGKLHLGSSISPPPRARSLRCDATSPFSSATTTRRRATVPRVAARFPTLAAALERPSEIEKKRAFSAHCDPARRHLHP